MCVCLSVSLSLSVNVCECDTGGRGEHTTFESDKATDRLLGETLQAVHDNFKVFFSHLI
jgi:hypothetical protein